jgi:hypothetical protein
VVSWMWCVSLGALTGDWVYVGRVSMRLPLMRGGVGGLTLLLEAMVDVLWPKLDAIRYVNLQYEELKALQVSPEPAPRTITRARPQTQIKMDPGHSPFALQLTPMLPTTC